MNRSFSIYLDLVRFTAAFLVYLYHSNQRLLVKEILPASGYGHSSVIVFFVLSGFVIAFVTDTKERDWKTYAASRLSRVLSVAVPAVVLTLILDSIGRQLMPALYSYPFDSFVVRTVSSLLMLNEIWLTSITSFSNVPYWSICYESWYYLLFGLMTFMKSRLKWVCLVLLALLLGPKIVLLAPVWLAGVGLYRWKALEKISVSAAAVLLLASIVGIIAFHWAGVEPVISRYFKGLIGESLHKELTFSKFFVSDYLLTLLVFSNFVAMRRLAPMASEFWIAIEKPVRWVAGFTFTLYLLHQPLFLFWGAVVAGDPSGNGYWLITTGLVLVSVVVVGHFTESRRHNLKAWITHILTSVAPQRVGGSK